MWWDIYCSFTWKHWLIHSLQNDFQKTSRTHSQIQCQKIYYLELHQRNMKLYSFLLTCCFWLLLRVKSQSTRGASHHPAFMGNCPTISHTFFSLIYPVDEFSLKGMRTWGQSKSYCFFVWCESRLLLRLQYCSVRRAFYHIGFMSNCPTINHTLFALSRQWMSSPSTEWECGFSLRIHIIVDVLVWMKRIRKRGELLWGEWSGLVYKEVVEALSNYKKS